MPLVHKDGIELQLFQQVDRIRHSYESIRLKIDLLVVAHAHFAEAGEVGSELVQQGSQGNRDQNLGMAENGTLALVLPRDPLATHSLVSG